MNIQAYERIVAKVALSPLLPFHRHLYVAALTLMLFTYTTPLFMVFNAFVYLFNNMHMEPSFFLTKRNPLPRFDYKITQSKSPCSEP